ncbi:hypothetical protein BDA96_05G162100 [Sorghum bicolor]|uniref:Bowman-Birk serine protease inhibitors family domain-containing protein n=2 Tax=Sorghum bicolor TaxID=4558 RepID=A0A921UG06_SORBI|nr:hypothetical protein BDA96_05G162100 [Sorghum bicolor]KXG28654.1 hypothetical protein SORBI_3005G148600 [Sorghum bicolor]
MAVALLFKKSSTSINELITVPLLVLLIMASTSPSFQVQGKGNDGRQQGSPALGQPLSCTPCYYKTAGDCSFKQWRNECPSDIDTTNGSCYKLPTGLNVWLCCCVPMINT